MSLLLPLLVATLLSGQEDKQVSFNPPIKLAPVADGKPSIWLQQYLDRVKTTKLSPRKFGEPASPWEFEWVVMGYGHMVGNDGAYARFAVYSQQSSLGNSTSLKVTRMLMQMWRHNYYDLQLDHSSHYENGLVDVYLCWGGKAGGEQLFDVDKQGGDKQVNTIYFYDLSSFTKPMEMAREVAHEYGHAALPAVGGFKEPEDWANGYLGEKVFLSWMRDEMAEGRLTPEDTMGATKADLDAWLAANANPLVDKVALHGPDTELIASTGKPAMDAYLGLALYTREFLSDSVFARSIKMTGMNAKDYPDSVVLAAEEPEQMTIHVPARLSGKAIWVPLSQGQVLKGAVLQRKGAWAKIQPVASNPGVVPKKPSANSNVPKPALAKNPAPSEVIVILHKR